MPIYTGSSRHLGGTETVKHKEENYYGLVQKNVLVTGGAGQLGSELERQTNKLNSALRFIYTDAAELDITDKAQVEQMVEDLDVQYIINCAAYTAVDKAESDKEIAFLINTKGVQNLTEVAKEHGCKFIHVSTDYVFDGTATQPYKETDATNPLSVYGITKLQAEEAILQSGAEAVILRTSWLFSEYNVNFVKTMLRLMNERDEISVVADQQGTPTYAADLAEMILVILDEAEKEVWKSGIYHFSNSGATTWFGFASKIKELAGLECKINPVTTAEYPTAAARPAYSIFDKTKIEEAFHVTIPSWENALERCLNRLNGDY